MYYQPNSCNTYAEHEWAGGIFLRQQKRVPQAQAQRVYLEEPIRYPVHTGLISLSVHPSVRPSVHLSEIQKNEYMNVGIKIKKSHLSVVPSLQISIPMLL